MRRILLLLPLLLGFSASAAILGVGANLDGRFDGDPTMIYADIVYSARNWGTTAQPWNEGTCPSFDANGWPAADCGIRVLGVSGSVLTDIDGTYAMSWNSTATPTVTPTGTGWTVSGVTCSGGACTASLVAAATAIGTVDLAFTGTGSPGGVRNLKIMRPIYPGSSTSHPITETWNRVFLQALKERNVPYVRLMDWHSTNQNPERNWSDRTPLTWAVKKGTLLDGSNYNGGPWELACSLASAAGVDLWINVPVLATDSYVTNLATLLKSNCPASTKIIVEYSNEIWNTGGGFGQFQQNYDMAQCEAAANAWAPSTAYTTAANGGASASMYAVKGTHCYKAQTGGTTAASGGPTGTGWTPITDGTVQWTYVEDPKRSPAQGGVTLTWNGETNQYVWARKRVGERLKEISDLFKGVYGASAMGTQVLPVLMGHIDGSEMQAALDFVNGKYGNPSQWFYGAGAAFYWGESASTSADATATATRIIEESKNSIAAVASPQSTNVANYVKRWGMHLFAYEGGYATGDTSGTALTAQTAANDDSRIATLYKDWLKALRDAGFEYVTPYQFVYAPSSFGVWGETKLVTQRQGPKFLGIAAWPTYEYQRPRYTFTQNGNKAIWQDGTAFVTGGTSLACNQSGTSLNYTFYVPGSGVGKLVFTYVNSVTGAIGTLNLNGNPLFAANALPDHSGANATLTYYPKFAAGANNVEYICGDANQTTVVSIVLSDH